MTGLLAITTEIYALGELYNILLYIVFKECNKQDENPHLQSSSIFAAFVQKSANLLQLYSYK